MAAQRLAKQLAMRIGWGMRSFGEWLEYRRRLAAFKTSTAGVPVHRIEKPIGQRTRHTYDIASGSAFTTFQMEQRWRIVAALYLEKLTSLLDIGCCRGWFVIQAALRPECERAVGIDVLPGFIDAANEARQRLNLQDKVLFEFAFLDDIVNHREKYRPPFQTIVLLNTYHYMYWGSSLSPKHWADHEYLLRTLSEICTDRVIFMGPLEVEDCPGDIKKRAREHPEWAPSFTTQQFLSTAGRYFDISLQTHLGVRPLYLLKKK